jgi:predicted DNA-binding transcriptional regulator AlpA
VDEPTPPLADLGTPVSIAQPLDELLTLLRDRLVPPEGTIDRTAFAALLFIGLTAFDTLRASGKLGPRPFKVGGSKTLRWHRPEVTAWLANRDHAGELYDATGWPPVWEAIRGRSK